MTTAGTEQGSGIRLGLHVNLAQFSLLVGVNALVGGMIGQERTVLPLLAERGFEGLRTRDVVKGGAASVSQPRLRTERPPEPTPALAHATRPSP